MSFTPEITSVNQHLQIGAESTSALGTNVSAGKVLLPYSVVFQPKGTTSFYRGEGRKYPSVQEQNTEHAESDWSGPLDYNSLQYVLAGVFGSAAVAANQSSATAKQWVYTPPVTGTIVPQTYTVEQGDSTLAHKVNYLLFTDFGYVVSRESATMTAKAISRTLTSGITLTSSPTTVALAPIPGKHFNFYMDTASGSLGGTQLTKSFQVTYSMPSVYTPFWPVNRSTSSFTSHVDMAPAASIKILMEADTTAMGLLSNWQLGSTSFIRVDALGTVAIANDVGGGSGPIYNEFTHDMAVKFGEPSQLQDKNGVYAIEWSGTIVEDATWGKAQTATVVNLITAL